MVNNQIIAEYLGWKLINLTEKDKLNNPDYDESDECWVFHQNSNETGMSSKSYSGEDYEILNKNSDIPYDSDWNWYHEALDQISKDFENFKEDISDELWDSFKELQIHTRNSKIIEGTDCMVRFINELNRIKNDTKA